MAKAVKLYLQSSLCWPFSTVWFTTAGFLIAKLRRPRRCGSDVSPSHLTVPSSSQRVGRPNNSSQSICCNAIQWLRAVLNVKT